MPLKLTTYYRGKDIPDLPGTNTFHSKELFKKRLEKANFCIIVVLCEYRSKMETSM